MAKVENILNEIKELKVNELNELVKAIEVEFGVSATFTGGTVDKEAKQENVEKLVRLVSPGGNKVAIIKIVKDLLGLGLMDAKNFVDKAPAIIKENIKPEEAEEIAKQLRDAGAEVVVE